MNRRKMMYNRYYNRRRSSRRKIFITFCCLAIIGFYSYSKLKDTSIVDFISNKVISWNNSIENDNNDITSKDISKELEDLNKKKEEENSNENSGEGEEKSNETAEVSKVSTINGWNAYTIQVASTSNGDELKEIQENLTSSKIPFSIVEKDGVKKVQTFCSFDKNVTRGYMGKVKEKYPDSFVSTLEAPMVSLKYTNKYNAADTVAKEINELGKNLEEESKLWNKNADLSNIDKDSYVNLISKRKTIIENIQKNAEKLNFSEMQKFKNGLIKYSQDIGEKTEISKNALDDSKYDTCMGLMLSSVQGYWQFINSIE